MPISTWMGRLSPPHPLPPIPFTSFQTELGKGVAMDDPLPKATLLYFRRSTSCLLQEGSGLTIAYKPPLSPFFHHEKGNEIAMGGCEGGWMGGVSGNGARLLGCAVSWAGAGYPLSFLFLLPQLPFPMGSKGSRCSAQAKAVELANHAASSGEEGLM